MSKSNVRGSIPGKSRRRRMHRSQVCVIIRTTPDSPSVRGTNGPLCRVPGAGILAMGQATREASADAAPKRDGPMAHQSL